MATFTSHVPAEPRRVVGCGARHRDRRSDGPRTEFSTAPCPTTSLIHRLFKDPPRTLPPERLVVNCKRLGQSPASPHPHRRPPHARRRADRRGDRQRPPVHAARLAEGDADALRRELAGQVSGDLGEERAPGALCGRMGTEPPSDANAERASEPVDERGLRNVARAAGFPLSRSAKARAPSGLRGWKLSDERAGRQPSSLTMSRI